MHMGAGVLGTGANPKRAFEVDDGGWSGALGPRFIHLTFGFRSARGTKARAATRAGAELANAQG